MARTRFKVLFVGRRPAVPRKFVELFESAGFSLSRDKARVRRDRLDTEIQAILSDGVTTEQLTRALHGAGSLSARVHIRAFTAEPMVANRSAPSRTRKGQSARVIPISLQALRESVGRTQGEIARRVSMTQPQLSRVEARRDHLTSTLRKYVRALGGKVEVVAVLKGRRLVIRDV
jgi:Helix-turn-helix domain